jgi:hypothetical protein
MTAGTCGCALRDQAAEIAALGNRVDDHDAEFEALFKLMRDTVKAAGIDLEAAARRELRRGRHLHLVKGGQQ